MIFLIFTGLVGRSFAPVGAVTILSTVREQPAMVRALRPEASRDPVFRRYFIREGRALAEVASRNLHVDDDLGSVPTSRPSPEEVRATTAETAWSMTPQNVPVRRLISAVGLGMAVTRGDMLEVDGVWLHVRDRLAGPGHADLGAVVQGWDAAHGEEERERKAQLLLVAAGGLHLVRRHERPEVHRDRG